MHVAPDDRWSRGLDAYASQFAIPREDVLERLRGMLGEPLAHEAIHAAGGAWNEGALSLRDRSLIVLTALAAQGVERRMRPHVRWAIEHGSSRAELEELVALLGVYLGFPRASVAAEVIREELEALETQ